MGKENDFLRPSIIVERNPDISKSWHIRDIGYLLRLGLVRVRKLLRGCEVSESDVRKVYSQAVINKKK